MKMEIDEKILIYGEADKLARVFGNILKNAIAYGDAGSEITVQAAKGVENVVVTFVNRGAEIPKHQLEHIFEKFYRSDSADLQIPEMPDLVLRSQKRLSRCMVGRFGQLAIKKIQIYCKTSDFMSL